ncbi:MAG: LuxR C-terminal-related transcriptional regulator [Flavihumibacter sp.]|jgi:DNA-binding CsgD family transcriptional regulator|nr:LuxR C-terminal-related transcriptional regulator [Flavihumibacter sp.]
MSKTFLDNAILLWEGIVTPDARNSNYLPSEQYKKFFQFLQIGDFYYYVFDFNSMKVDYVSSSIEQVLGYPNSFDMQEFLNSIHPDDQPYYLNFEHAAIQFLKALPVEKLGNYKIQYDFRVKNSKGNFIRILHQAILIDFDDQKNFIRSLSVHTNIHHIKENGKPCLSFIGLQGEPSFIDVKAPEIFETTANPFTRREKEILKLMIDGYKSEQIATCLYISLHTVNTHRKNILAKSGATSIVELIGLTIKNGWL